jgi:hypothetical protein
MSSQLITHPARIALLFLAELLSVDDLGDVFFRQLVLPLAFNKVLGGIDKQHVVGFLALL